MANTNPEEWRVALAVVAHCKVVWFGPQDLHDVFIELGLFLLPSGRERERERERECVSVNCVQQCYQPAPTAQLHSAEQWPSEGDWWSKNRMHNIQGHRLRFIELHACYISREGHCCSHVKKEICVKRKRERGWCWMWEWIKSSLPYGWSNG